MRKRVSFIVCVLLMAVAAPALAAGAEPIKPGVVVHIVTASGLKKVKVGGLLPAEAKEKLADYDLRSAPGSLSFIDRDWTRVLKTSGLGLKPSIKELVKLASVADTATAVGTDSYMTTAAAEVVAARVKAFAKQFKVKAKTVEVAGGGKLKNFGGRELDVNKATQMVVDRLEDYGRGKLKKIGEIEASVVNSKAKMTQRKGMGKVLVASLAQRRVYLYQGEKLLVSYGICIGQPGYKTPTGTMRVANKAKNPTWNNPNAPWSQGMAESISGAGGPLGKAALYLTRNGKDEGIRFHGTVKDYSIGHAQSHGCMRMNNSDILKLYTRVPVGTPVTVTK